MMKYLLLFSIFFLMPLTSQGAESVCTMEYAPVCGQPPMPLCPPGLSCIQVMPQPQTYGNSCMMRAAGATQLYAGECNTSPPKACTKEYAPVCGMKPIQCITAPCDPIRTDYGNRCMAEADGATEITDGTCQMSESTPPIVGGDRDVHGCIGSAGYSWDESLRTCIRSWEYQPKVDWAYENKITKYNTLSEFKYGNTLTRQEAAAFITRYLIDGLGRPEALCKLAYRDSATIDSSLMPAISRACGMGVMYGDAGYFSPRRGLTRGEALAVLIRAIDQKKQDEKTKPWYQGYMDRAFALGLQFANMRGFDEPISRGEFVEWLQILSESQTPVADSLLTGEWKLERFTDTQGKEWTITGTFLTFTVDRFSTRLCNSISGNYSVKGGVISTDGVMSTMMACADILPTMLEGAFDMDGATYSIARARVMPGYTGSTTWLRIMQKDGAVFTLSR